MDQTIQWTHRREVLLQLEKGIYTAQLRPTALRDAFKQVCGGRHARADVVVECSPTVLVDSSLLKLLLEEGVSNAIKYREPGTRLLLRATTRPVSTPSAARAPMPSAAPDPFSFSPLLGTSPARSSRGSTPGGSTPGERARNEAPVPILELYVQLTNSNRKGVRKLNAEECMRAFQPGVTLDSKSTAASTGVGLHTVMLGVASAGGHAWLSVHEPGDPEEDEDGAEPSSPHLAKTTFHFTLLASEQAEGREKRGQRRCARNGTSGTPNPGCGSSAQEEGAISLSGGDRRPAKPSKGGLESLPFRRRDSANSVSQALEGLPFPKIRPGNAVDTPSAAVAARAGAGGEAAGAPPLGASEHSERLDKATTLQPLSITRLLAHANSSSSVAASTLGSDSPSMLSDVGAPCLSDVLCLALDDSHILRSYMLNVFKRMGAHPASRSLGGDEEEVDSFVEVALGIQLEAGPSSIHSSGLAPRRCGAAADAPSPLGASSALPGRGRAADMLVLDYNIELDDGRVVNGGELADTLRARGFSGLIALFSGIAMAEEAQQLARGSIDIVIRKGSGPGQVQDQLTDAWLGHKHAGSAPVVPLIRPSPLVRQRPVPSAIPREGAPPLAEPPEGGLRLRQASKKPGLLGQSAQWF